jgi:hypothetical protein
MFVLKGKEMTKKTMKLVERLSNEADLCRNDGANDIAALLDDAAKALAEKQLAEPCRCGKQTTAWCMANTCSKAEQPAPVQQEPWKPTEADYKEWWDRHGLHAPTARAAFEDAASLYLTAAPQPAQQQKPTGMLHIDRLDKWLDASLKERKAQRTWADVPDEEIKILWIQYRAALPRYLCFANALLARAKEKNT